MGSQRLAATMVDSSIPYRPWKNKLLQMWKLACSVEQGIIVLLQSLPNNKKVEKAVNPCRNVSPKKSFESISRLCADVTSCKKLGKVLHTDFSSNLKNPILGPFWINFGPYPSKNNFLSLKNHFSQF